MKVYGHSIAAIDVDYMETIEQMIKPAVWEVLYYKDKADMEETVKTYSFAKKAKLFEW